jgi:hypothetical protein
MSVSRFQQGTLHYEEHGDELAALAEAIDLLGHKDIAGALKVLMALRNHLQDSQQPRVVEYDPQHPGARP